MLCVYGQNLTYQESLPLLWANNLMEQQSLQPVFKLAKTWEKWGPTFETQMETKQITNPQYIANVQSIYVKLDKSRTNSQRNQENISLIDYE